MCIRWIAALFCAVGGQVTVPGHATAEQGASTTEGAPELAIAVVGERGTLDVHRCVKRMVESEITDDARTYQSGGADVPTSHIEVVPIVETLITCHDATKIVARRIDGRAVSYKTLMEVLSKPTPVVILEEGGDVEEPFSTIFKPETLVLTLPHDGDADVRGEHSMLPRSLTPVDERPSKRKRAASNATKPRRKEPQGPKRRPALD